MELCREVLAPYGDRVSVDGFNSLLVDYVRSKNTRFVLRGLRTVTDFDYEFQMAEMNRSLDPQLEYVFLPTSRTVRLFRLPWFARYRRWMATFPSSCTQPLSPPWRKING